MNNLLFTGTCTALVTPFLGGKVNYPMLEQLLRRQIDAGIRAVVICGTTGESPTLSDDEKLEMFRRAKKYVGDSCMIIAGTGSNCTEHAVTLSRAAEALGVDALLVVSPYYNKATPKGLIKSFKAVAENVSIPIILYNVPSRTGCNLTPASCAILAKHENIVGIKEASGNISQVAEIAALTNGEFDIYSGNDDQIVPLMSLGGKGVISVVANILPKKTVELCDKFFAGDLEGSRNLQLELLPLINSLFCEVNPIPVKAATAAIGFGENFVRLPLTTMEPENEAKMRALMREQGLNV